MQKRTFSTTPHKLDQGRIQKFFEGVGGFENILYGRENLGGVLGFFS